MVSFAVAVRIFFVPFVKMKHTSCIASRYENNFLFFFFVILKFSFSLNFILFVDVYIVSLKQSYIRIFINFFPNTTMARKSWHDFHMYIRTVPFYFHYLMFQFLFFFLVFPEFHRHFTFTLC